VSGKKYFFAENQYNALFIRVLAISADVPQAPTKAFLGMIFR